MPPLPSSWARGTMFQQALPSQFPQPRLRHRPLQGCKRTVAFMGGRGFYASGVSAVLSYSSLNSKYLCLKPLVRLAVGLQPDVGPWRSTCPLKYEVPEPARHQIIPEGEMFGCYFSLLRLLWFGFNCGSFHLPFGCPFCSSACSVAEISRLSNLFLRGSA